MSAVPSFEIIGPPDAPVVIVLGGISASRHVASHDGDPSPGWWEHVVGPERAIDTRHFFVLGVDWLDGGRASDGRPERIVTTHAQADAIADVLDRIGVVRVQAIVGASYGGMVALAFAERFPERVEQLVVVSASHRPHPMATALRSLQRGIVELGLDTDAPSEALALARGLAMTTYRTAREFEERFDAHPLTLSHRSAAFASEAYLRHHGQRFAQTWRPERFLALSLSADLHRVEPEAIRVPALLVAAEGDAIIPRDHMRELADRLGAVAHFVEIPTTRGHDAFLTEPARIGQLLRAELCTPACP